MKINKKFLSVILLGTVFIMLGIPNKSKAALQSNGGTPTAKDLNSWMLQIRKMQELGGTLGRTDTINTTDLTSEATDLDIHMEKNTEYGAMAILSASAYGNPNKINDGETTTGNSTGVVINLNKEWVAAGTISSSSTNFKSAASRYKNLYEHGTHLKGSNSYAKYIQKSGDAIEETKGWHGSSSSIWLSYYGYVYSAFNSVELGLLRCYSGSIFSYNGYSARFYNNGDIDTIGDAYYTRNWYSRAAIVVGTDL